MLAGAVLASFAGGGLASRGPAAGVGVEYQGRRFELPEARERLAEEMRAADLSRPKGAECLRLGRGMDCLSNAPRFVLGLPLDLNRATAAELERLPGLGRKRAEEIVAERNRRGGFQNLEECRNLAAVPAAAAAALAREFVVEASSRSDADSARQNQ